MQYLVQIFTGESMEAWERLSEPEQDAVHSGVLRDLRALPA